MSVIILWLLSTPIFSQFLIDQLQQQYKPLTLSDHLFSQQPGAITVLGGGAGLADTPEDKYIVNGVTRNRLRYGVYIHQKLAIPIIVSGGKIPETDYIEADLMLKDLKDHFKIPAEWKEDRSLTTRDEAKFMLPILKEHHIKKAFIVTNAWHMPRAMWVFERYFRGSGIELVACPMGRVRVINNTKSIMNYTPSLTGLNVSAIALHEWWGLVVYAFIG